MRRAPGTLAAALLAIALGTAACGLAPATLPLRVPAGAAAVGATTLRLPIYTGAGVAAPGTAGRWPPPPGTRARSQPLTVMAPAAASLVAAWIRAAFRRLGYHLAARPAHLAGWWVFAGRGAQIGVHLHPIGGGETEVTYLALRPA
jgi:hypothetical protein